MIGGPHSCALDEFILRSNDDFENETIDRWIEVRGRVIPPEGACGLLVWTAAVGTNAIMKTRILPNEPILRAILNSE